MLLLDRMPFVCGLAAAISMGLRGNIGGVMLSNELALMNGLRVDEPAKLLRRLAAVNLASGSDS